MTVLEAFGATWAATVLPWAMESTLVGILLLVGLRLGRRWPAGLRVGVATIGLAKLALPPALLPIGLLSVGVVDRAGMIGPLGGPVAHSSGLAPWLGVLGLIHVAGVAAGSMLLAARLRELRQLRSAARLAPRSPLLDVVERLSRRFGLHRPPGLLISHRVRVPFVTGLWRPVVVLPAALAAGGRTPALESVIAHELAHLRSGDLWLGWLRAIASIVWWPSPVARWLARAQEAAIEERADDRVVDLRLVSTGTYARSLVEVASLAADLRPGASAVAATGSGHLEDRIRRLATNRRPLKAPARILTFVVLAALLLPAGATGALSTAGWTTRVLLSHQAPPSTAKPLPSHDPRHDQHGR